MKNRTQSEEVERLSGFLFGVSIFSGSLRQYESFAYLLSSSDEHTSVGDLINEYFHGQHQFCFLETEELLEGLKAVEKGIREYLIMEKGGVRSEQIQEMRRYISFRVMDMIRDVFDCFGKKLSVRVCKVQAAISPSLGQATFFSIRSDTHLLVLQFNDYTGCKANRQGG